MIKITTIPKETLVELLFFLAENEAFSSVSEKLKDGVTVDETRYALRELACELAREVSAEQGATITEAKASATLSRKTKEIMSYLSPNEEKTLLTAFGLTDKK